MDSNGRFVNPQELPEYLQDNPWERPTCFCSIRGNTRTTVLSLVPDATTSPACGAMCLVCPKSECPYFGTANFISVLSLACSQLNIS